MYAVVSKAGAFLCSNKNDAMEMAISKYGRPRESLYGWLFWTPETLDLLLKMNCNIIMSETQKEVSANRFVAVYRQTESEFSKSENPVFA